MQSKHEDCIERSGTMTSEISPWSQYLRSVAVAAEVAKRRKTKFMQRAFSRGFLEDYHVALLQNAEDGRHGNRIRARCMAGWWRTETPLSDCVAAAAAAHAHEREGELACRRACAPLERPLATQSY
jgi:hypothetical protein